MESNSIYNICDSEQKRIAQAIVDKFAEFDVLAELAEIVVGATVTRYVFDVLSPKTRMSDVVGRSYEIQQSIQSPCEVMINSLVGKTMQVGVEVANAERRLVELSALLEKPEFKSCKGELAIVLGEDVEGRPVVCDLAKMPHLLIAGTTGSGKSMLLNDIILSLISKYEPEYLRLLITDVKSFELSVYDGAPHMLTRKVITETSDVFACMDYLIDQMELRYRLFTQQGARSISEYNKSVEADPSRKLPYLVFAVDEFAELMRVDKIKFETELIRLAQKCRSAGIHIVLATQRPDRTVLTGSVMFNMPCRAALKVCSVYDSQTVLHSSGAEKLIGRGDMLLMDPSSFNGFKRVQCAYVSTYETRLLVERLASEYSNGFDEAVSDAIFVSGAQAKGSNSSNASDAANGTDAELCTYYAKALRYWLEHCGGKASIASVQRGLCIGYRLAAGIFESLQKMGYVETPLNSDGTVKPLKVLVTSEEIDRLFPEVK